MDSLTALEAKTAADPSRNHDPVAVRIRERESLAEWPVNLVIRRLSTAQETANY
jgi:hypothetical protein